MKNLILSAILLIGIAAYSQDEKPTIDNTDKFDCGIKINSTKWFFNYNIITPTGIIYFDQGEDELDQNGVLTRPDFYKNGSANFNLQLLSGDIFYGESWIRGGITFGAGLSSNSGESSQESFIIANLGAAISLNQNIRVEFGYSIGISANESYSKKYDYAVYFGLSFPTNIGENIKKAIRKTKND